MVVRPVSQVPPKLWLSLFTATAVVLGLTAWELFTHSSIHAISILIAPPMIVALFFTWPVTLGIGAASVVAATAIVYSMPNLGIHPVHQHWVDIGLIVIAALSAIALSVSRERGRTRLEAATEIAAVAQKAIMRPLPKKTGPFLIAARYIAPQQGTQIGGDLYEVLETQFGVRFIVGDARGHGLKTVRLTSTVLGAFRFVAFDRADLTYLASGLDQSVSRNATEEDFVTGLLGQERGGTLELVNAGHPPPLLLRNGTVDYLETRTVAPPFGLGGSYTSVSFRLRPGDRVLLYTDGLAEARREGEFFPLFQRAQGLIGHGDVGDALDSLEDAVRDWIHNQVTDDIALMLLEYVPQTASPPRARAAGDDAPVQRP